MHLLYSLPQELQQVILATALCMHLHRAPAHRMLDDRPFYFYYVSKAARYCKYFANPRLNYQLTFRQPDAVSLLFMAYVLHLIDI